MCIYVCYLRIDKALEGPMALTFDTGGFPGMAVFMRSKLTASEVTSFINFKVMEFLGLGIYPNWLGNWRRQGRIFLYLNQVDRWRKIGEP